jgi:hemerythrin-like domain-containing protein
MRYPGSLDERYAAAHTGKENAMATRNETRSRPKDAIALLRADHHKVRQLFRAYRAARDPATQWEIALHIFDELEVHAQLEEVVFYQAVEEETTSLGKRLVHASLEEHEEALVLIQDLRSLAPGCPEFDTKFQALVLTVEHHMTEEETEMFPLAEAEVGEDLRDLRDEMLHIKAHLLAS